MTRSLSRRVLFAMAALVCVLGTATPPAAAADAVTLRLEWRLSGYHVPFYWAKEKGYYAAENLDVDIKEGAGSGVTVSLISGRQDTFGFADYMLMAASAAKGMKVKGVYALIQNAAWAIVSHADKPIKTPQDMIGKSIAMTADHKAMFDLFLSVNKIDPAKVKVQVTSPATRNTVFVNGQVDAFLSVVIGSPLDLVVRARQGKGKPVHFMQLEDYDVAPLGAGIVVHDQTVAEKPDMIRRFLRATARGLADTLKPENFDEGVDIAMRMSKASEERRESVKLQWIESLPRLRTRNTMDKPYGWTADKDADLTIDILVKTGRIEKPLPAKNFYLNDFVPN